MSSKSGQHDPDCTDQVFLYALQALTPNELPAVESHIAGCQECQAELETLRPVIGSFAGWPTNVLRPSQSLWERLAHRIAGETGQAPLLQPPPPPQEPQWQEAAPGISVKLLATHTEKNLVTMLVRLEPGTDYPAHCHAGTEELHLLDGELMVDDRKLYPGDYIHAVAGTVDHRVWSETGCTCVLITSAKDEIL